MTCWRSLWKLDARIYETGGPGGRAPGSARSAAQTAEELFRRNIGSPDQFNKQFPPHKVIGNIYYVGSESLASFLFVTPQGNILLNSCFEATVPVIRASVEKLGFKFTDIKILLGSHAHADHMQGDAMVKAAHRRAGDGHGRRRPGADEDHARKASRIRSTGPCTMATK